MHTNIHAWKHTHPHWKHTHQHHTLTHLHLPFLIWLFVCDHPSFITPGLGREEGRVVRVIERLCTHTHTHTHTDQHTHTETNTHRHACTHTQIHTVVGYSFANGEGMSMVTMKPSYPHPCSFTLCCVCPIYTCYPYSFAYIYYPNTYTHTQIYIPLYIHEIP